MEPKALRIFVAISSLACFSLCVACHSLRHAQNQQIREQHVLAKDLGAVRVIAFSIPQELDPSEVAIEVNGIFQHPNVQGSSWYPSVRHEMDRVYNFHVVAENKPMNGTIIDLRSNRRIHFVVGVSEGYWWTIEVRIQDGTLVVRSNEYPEKSYL